MSLTAKDRATSRLSIQDQVLAALQAAGRAGVSGEALAPISWRFGGAIHALRQKGWAIQTKDQPGTDGKLYVLDSTIEKPSGQLDALAPRPPFRPAAGMVTGVCECHHVRGAHHLGSGYCRECNCSHYKAEA